MDYDPVAGWFLPTDPTGYQDQFNLYAYVGNDPGNKTDPMGEKKFDADAWASELADTRETYEQLDTLTTQINERRSTVVVAR
tara:strand:+ start:554 stop:799 length:246 start_codon:yes stop_codon:yes gene_type:complete